MFLSFFVCIFVTVKHKTTITIMAQEIIKTVVENKVSESDALINKMKEYLPESFFETYIDNIKHDSFLMNSDTNLAHEGDYVRFVKAFTNNAVLLFNSNPNFSKYIDIKSLVRICVLMFIGNLGMFQYDPIGERKGHPYKFADNNKFALFFADRTIARLMENGVIMCERDIEIINCIKRFNEGEKMTTCFASPSSRLIKLAYDKTILEFMIK